MGKEMVVDCLHLIATWLISIPVERGGRERVAKSENFKLPLGNLG